MNSELKEQGKNIEKSYVGIDIGKKSLEVCRLFPDGQIERFECKTDFIGLNKLLKWLNKDDIVCLEAGNQAFRIVKFIMANTNIKAYALNPGDVANIYNSMRKTDKEDALKLARLIARNPVDELPVVPVPSDEIEDARNLLSEQTYWSKQLTSSKNRLHALFTHAGMTMVVKKEIKSYKRRIELMEKLPENFRKQATRLNNSILEIEKKLKEVNNEIKEILQENNSYTSIAMSIPGVGPITTFAFYSHLEDCKRFSSASQVSNYARFVPRVDISGNTVRYGRITRGASAIKRPLIQAAWSLVRSKYGGSIKEFYERLFPRIGKKKAIVATARKMLEVFYVMITSGEYYRGMPEDMIFKKMKQYGISM